ncbi:MAG: pyridoxamine 5-phosphate oxidase [Acidimicrobiaceae bacterium]|jgi:pyridoxamine 5'-phosphate oxidase|nr:pyridoxamine 5-phosphate oxidase [Acidimicrobiaceae bacterium]
MDDPLALARQWLADAAAAGIHEPNAMSLATGHVSLRTVLLKGISDGGFVFFTNYQSRKAVELEADPTCALSLTWPTLGRQIRATGRATRTSAQESDDYFATRPRGSQVAAWASPQSEVLADRAALDALVADVEQRFAGVDRLPRPPHWGGYRVTPDEIEFWTRRDNRLHDRLRYRRADHQGEAQTWAVDRLAP